MNNYNHYVNIIFHAWALKGNVPVRISPDVFSELTSGENFPSSKNKKGITRLHKLLFN